MRISDWSSDVCSSDLLEIAAEKAGIAKSGAPLITMKYPDSVSNTIQAMATQARAPYFAMGQDWDAAVYRDKLHYRDVEGRIATQNGRASCRERVCQYV